MIVQAVFAHFMANDYCGADACDYWTHMTAGGGGYHAYWCLLFQTKLPIDEGSDYYDKKCKRCKECLAIFNDRTNRLKKDRKAKYVEEDSWDLK